MNTVSKLEQLTSEELAVGARTGSEEYFSELVRRHRDSLFRLLCRRVPSREDAEDLTQETFLRAQQKLDLFKPAHKFETWLFTIGTRLSYNFYRKHKNEVIDHEEFDQAVLDTPVTILSISEEHGNLWNTVARILPKSQAEILWHRYGNDLSIKDISSRTGRSQVHVKVLLHRARTSLANHFKKENRS